MRNQEYGQEKTIYFDGQKSVSVQKTEEYGSGGSQQKSEIQVTG